MHCKTCAENVKVGVFFVCEMRDREGVVVRGLVEISPAAKRKCLQCREVCKVQIECGVCVCLLFIYNIYTIFIIGLFGLRL